MFGDGPSRPFSGLNADSAVSAPDNVVSLTEWQQRSNTTPPTPSCAKLRESGTALWSSPTAVETPKSSTQTNFPSPRRSCGLWRDRGGQNPGGTPWSVRRRWSVEEWFLMAFMWCNSRRLWKHVTKSLKDGNIDEATEHKHRLEERQRGEEKQRAADNRPWKPKYFTKEVRKKQGPVKLKTSLQRPRRSWWEEREQITPPYALEMKWISLHQGDGWMYIHPLWKSTWRLSPPPPTPPHPMASPRWGQASGWDHQTSRVLQTDAEPGAKVISTGTSLQLSGRNYIFL